MSGAGPSVTRGAANAPSSLRPLARRFRRRLYEWLGSDRYSRPSLHEIDRKLERHLPERDGFFVEAGGNDGYEQSNTYYLERFRGWRGILIEPVPRLFEACRRERARSRVFRCALVAEGYPSDTIPMWDAGLMSLVKGALKSDAADAEHARRGGELQRIVPEPLTVPARTLSSVLDEVGSPAIDLLSLDVEGHELEVLRGLDLARHAPRLMVIETRFRAEIDAHLSAHGYAAIEELSDQDTLYRRA